MFFKSASSHWLHVKRISFGKWHLNVFRFILILSSFRYAKWRLGNKSSSRISKLHAYWSNDKTFFTTAKTAGAAAEEFDSQRWQKLEKAMALKKELFLSFAMSLKCTRSFVDLLTTILSLTTWRRSYDAHHFQISKVISRARMRARL